MEAVVDGEADALMEGFFHVELGVALLIQFLDQAEQVVGALGEIAAFGEPEGVGR